MHRPELVADCGTCAALCCVLSGFDASEDFAFSKPTGVRCPNLLPSCRCAIHDELVVRGLAGCAAYDCHGAGPRATRLFAATLLTRRQRHDAFAMLREIHELLWLLTGAAALCADEPELRGELEQARDVLDALGGASARELLATDLQPHRDASRQLCARVRAVLARRGLSPRPRPVAHDC